MKAKATTPLRANVVLLSICIGVADAVWLAIALLCGAHTFIGSIAMRGMVLATALAIMFLIRRRSRRAFDVALQGQYVQWSGSGRRGVATFSNHCPDAWLVQLYLELHPASASAGLCKPGA
jgi:hypothetical protein